MVKHEENLHIAVCNYLKQQYPKVIFTSEASGLKLTMGQAVKLKRMRSGDKLPDLWILEARGGYYGLLIELKATNPYKKDGSAKNDHIRGQIDVIWKLGEAGYAAVMRTGFDEVKEIIDHYMGMPNTKLTR